MSKLNEDKLKNFAAHKRNVSANPAKKKNRNIEIFKEVNKSLGDDSLKHQSKKIFYI